MVYRFIQANHPEFGLRWLLRKFNTCPNAYYNYLRHRKKGYRIRKEEICAEIEQTYHANNGNYGSRFIRVLLARKGIYRCRNTVRKYLNVELGLKAIVRRKKMKYAFFGEPHEVLENLVNRKFEAEDINKVWCTDFTYIKLSAGMARYNCTIIDLFDRSVVATLNSRHIDSQLAIDTLKKALTSQRIPPRKLILHSDQGSQFTSLDFTEFCKTHDIRQSMSRAGCPYDNAPMERFYNTLKHELIHPYHFHDDETLDEAIYKYSYVTYNHHRPHTYNNWRTPFEARSTRIRT